MADKIKSFFERKGGKFKGKGHKLTETAPPPKQKQEKPIARVDPTKEAKQAGLAALARLENKAPASSFQKPLSFKANMRTTGGSTYKSDPPTKAVEIVNSNPEILAVQGVYFKCPLISPEVLPKEEWKTLIRNFLYEQVEFEKGLTSCLMIHTLNKNREEVSQCVETLCTYLNNIIQNPEDEKYKKIRLSNKIFQEKVAKMEGTAQFLEAAGFEICQLPFKDVEEEFYVFSAEPVDCDHLEMLIDSLKSAEPVPLELDRNLQVLAPEVANKRNDLPDEFYRLSVEELKKEMQNRAERIETMMQLRTKAMREKEEIRELKKYRYTIIRVRFSDGILLQGTFNVYEKARAVKDFVQENLSSDGTFVLKNALGQELTAEEDESTLLDLKLVPAVLLTFEWQEAPQSSSKAKALKQEVLDLLQPAPNK